MDSSPDGYFRWQTKRKIVSLPSFELRSFSAQSKMTSVFKISFFNMLTLTKACRDIQKLTYKVNTLILPLWFPCWNEESFWSDFEAVCLKNDGLFFLLFYGMRIYPQLKYKTFVLLCSLWKVTREAMSRHERFCHFFVTSASHDSIDKSPPSSSRCFSIFRLWICNSLWGKTAIFSNRSVFWSSTSTFLNRYQRNTLQMMNDSSDVTLD